MADKHSRVGKERLGRPADEQVTGRAPGAGERPGDYTPSATTGRASSATPATASRRPSGTAPNRDRQTEQGADDDARARELRAEIEATREDMSETVNAIQDRLRPGHIASNAAESIKEAAADRTRELVASEPVQYVRANPIPTAMVGIGLAGLAWLAFGGREADDYRRYRSGSRGRFGEYSRGRREYGLYGRDFYPRDDAHETWDTDDRGAYGSYGRESGEGLTDRASEIAGDVRQKAEETTRRARHQARRARTSLQRTWNENPLVIGAASAVLGALVGMAVPESEVENEWMGERRDQMIEGVQEAVREKVDHVQHAAIEAADQVKQAVGISDKAEG